MRGSQASACGHVLRDVKFFIFRLRFMHKRKRLVSACSLHAHLKLQEIIAFRNSLLHKRRHNGPFSQIFEERGGLRV